MLFSVCTLATEGEGRFESREDDDQIFIEQQLLFNAFKAVITTEMNNSGLDAKDFWLKYHLKFAEYFAPIKEERYEQHKKKLELNKNHARAKVLEERYAKSLRWKRLKLMRKFGRLTKAIKSYSVKSRSRSPQRPKLRYIIVKAEVNRKLLNSVYFKFTQEQVEGALTHLYVSYDLVLDGISWQEIGVENSHDLTSVIQEHWKRKLGELFGTKIENIVITNAETNERLKLFYKSDNSETFDENADIQIASFYNGIWLKITNKIKKIDEKKFLKIRKFQVEGDVIALELKNKKNILYKDFKIEHHVYSYEDNHKLSSNLASLLYRIPMAQISLLPSKIRSINLGRRKALLKINNISNIIELFELRDILAYKGARLRVSSHLDRFKGDRGLLTLEYQGEPANIANLLLELKQHKIGVNKLITIPATDNPFELFLVADDNNNSQIEIKKPK